MIKLYDENSCLAEFTATVVECAPFDENFGIVLDKTAFFPTAGGQDCDTGEIDGQPVLDVRITGDTVYHIMRKPFCTEDTVHGKIDWNERFRKMQHHSAEHIVSGLAHSMFGAENVGFHLSSDEVTIDYDRELSSDDIMRLERRANSAVWDNIEITAVYPTEEELSRISYRSKKELDGKIRIVTIPGIDVCACCAPHVRRTGEIGIIKLKDAVRHRGGMRIRMICGGDALTDYEQKYASVLKISNLLSAKQAEVSQSVGRIMSELAEQKRKCAVLSNRLAVYKAREIPETDGRHCIFDDTADMNSARILADLAKEKCRTAAVFSGDDENGYSYVVMSKKEDLSKTAKVLNSALGGRGGGSPDIIQGYVAASRAEIEDFFLK